MTKKIQEKRTKQKHQGNETEELITLEVGFELIPLLGGDEQFITQVENLQKSIKNEVGVFVPDLKIVTSSFKETEYQIKIQEQTITGGTIKLNHLLALETSNSEKNINGTFVEDPIFGERAYWIKEKDAIEATEKRYIVVQPSTILLTHIETVIRNYLHEFVTRQDVKMLLKESNKEEIAKELPISHLQNIIKSFLIEQIPIKPINQFLDACVNAYEQETEYENRITLMRRELKRTISKSIVSEDGGIHTFKLTNEKTLMKKISRKNNKAILALDNFEDNQLHRMIVRKIDDIQLNGHKAVLIVQDDVLRNALVSWVRERKMPLQIITKEEVAVETPIYTH